MKCPKCGNNYCKIIGKAHTTGTDYSISKGLLGELLLGSVGFLCGFSNNRHTEAEVYWVCKRCGYKFKV